MEKVDPKKHTEIKLRIGIYIVDNEGTGKSIYETFKPLLFVSGFRLPEELHFCREFYFVIFIFTVLSICYRTNKKEKWFFLEGKVGSFDTKARTIQWINFCQGHFLEAKFEHKREILK